MKMCDATAEFFFSEFNGQEKFKRFDTRKINTTVSGCAALFF